MKTKPKPRARKMWANYYKAPFNPCLHKTRRAAALGCGPACIHTGRVAVIPLNDPLIVPALAALGIRLSKGGRK